MRFVNLQKYSLFYVEGSFHGWIFFFQMMKHFLLLI